MGVSSSNLRFAKHICLDSIVRSHCKCTCVPTVLQFFFMQHAVKLLHFCDLPDFPPGCPSPIPLCICTFLTPLCRLNLTTLASMAMVHGRVRLICTSTSDQSTIWWVGEKSQKLQPQAGGKLNLHYGWQYSLGISPPRPQYPTLYLLPSVNM